MTPSHHPCRRLCRISVLTLLLCVLLVRGDTSSPRTPPDAIIPVAEVKEGMPVVARTVFQGTRIESFAGEVVGVLHGFRPGRDLIIVRFQGDHIEHTGVAAGMSGSPVYIGDRLAGAISYRLSPFPLDLTAGVTPAEYMVKETRSLPDTDWAPGTATARRASAHAAAAALAPGWEHLATPLAISGLHPRAAQALTQELSGALAAPVVMPALAGGPAMQPATAVDGPWSFRQSPAVEGAPLTPGSPVAAVLAAGDISVAATGTVTRLEGNRLFAFGHPFLYQGSIRIPMAKAEIVATLGDQSAPYKLANIGRIVGTIDSDGLSAISGVVGPRPEMIPLAVSIARNGQAVEVIRTQVFAHIGLTPVIVRHVVLSAMYHAPLYDQQATYRLRGRIDIEGQRAVRFDQTYAPNGGGADIVPAHAAADFGDIFGGLYANPFALAKVSGIELTVDVSPGLRAWSVEGLLSAAAKVEAGKTLEVLVQLGAFRGEQRIETVRLELPANVRGVPIRLWAGSASALTAAGAQLGGGPQELAAARTLEQVIEVLNRRHGDDRVYVVAERVAPGAVIQHQLLPGLPASMLSMMDVAELRGSTDMKRWIISAVSLPVERAIVRGQASLLVHPR
ncbi:MAG: hypothetical protein HYV63_02270 [Candidatus Schekmanbacteria bacterium]|nr:hypothetical protein [Candidatus Schekmanbacteria bacterium]